MTADTLAYLLVKHGIVDPCAVEYAEGFDREMTLHAIRELAEDINERMVDRPDDPPCQTC